MAIVRFGEMRRLERVNVASALIFDESQERILLVRNRKGSSSYWSLPGGAVEAGETLEEALKRETREETGLEVEMSNLYSVREVFFTERKQHALLFTFLANIISGEISISDPDNEILEVKWTDLKTANDVMPYLPEAIKKNANDNNLNRYYYQGTVE